MKHLLFYTLALCSYMTHGMQEKGLLASFHSTTTPQPPTIVPAKKRPCLGCFLKKVLPISSQQISPNLITTITTTTMPQPEPALLSQLANIDHILIAYAAQPNPINIIQKLLNDGAEVDYIDENGHTALSAATGVPHNKENIIFLLRTLMNKFIDEKNFLIGQQQQTLNKNERYRYIVQKALNNAQEAMYRESCVEQREIVQMLIEAVRI
ncbi:MAG: hypothetical protein UU47_C0007G0029 [candidate division TM6 bacterium GW2011_GWE2_41_16]|nr:MAG: hypothetical protein UU47_C0007G0029 [candidate division TM6 bacterium GW2011_GWE2_41_16]